MIMFSSFLNEPEVGEGEASTEEAKINFHSGQEQKLHKGAEK